MTDYGASGRGQHDPGRGRTVRHARVRVCREQTGNEQDRVTRQPEIDIDKDAAVDEYEREDASIERRAERAIHTHGSRPPR
ncbi:MULTISPECIES: hypothetical protein [unclassified Frankia]|uniref:hypothetical protein n=1 Tax=unclassified Frankia TaxID=2632575 RepID=UPI001EF71150|nr:MULTISPECIES: hypothetical protein [unclassified Frankia]